MTAKFTKRDAVAEYVRRFPNHPTQTIAKVVYQQHPELFPSLDAARSVVRGIRGARKNMKPIKELQRPNSSPAEFAEWMKGRMPASKRQITDFSPVQIKTKKALILSDIHAPYHDEEALTIAIEHGQREGVDSVILNGDCLDFFSTSRFETDPRKRDLKGELATGREILKMIREAFPQAKIAWKIGNHEERWEKYLSLKAPELLGIDDFELASIFRTKSLNIQIVSDLRMIKVGKLSVIHGHEFRWGISAPVNPARGFYMRGKETMLGGHHHQSSEHSEKSMSGDVVVCWSTGCLCELNPAYMPYNKFNHGYAIVTTEGDGSFQVQNKKIIGGRVY